MSAGAETPYFVLVESDCREIAALKCRAEANPQPLDVTRTRVRNRLTQRYDADPPGNIVLLGGGYMASYLVEDWPDGRWRRLTLSHRHQRAPLIVVDTIMRAFGFGCVLAEGVRWGSREGSRGSAVNVCERIAAAAAPTGWQIWDSPPPAPAAAAGEDIAVDPEEEDEEAAL